MAQTLGITPTTGGLGAIVDVPLGTGLSDLVDTLHGPLHEHLLLVVRGLGTGLSDAELSAAAHHLGEPRFNPLRQESVVTIASHKDAPDSKELDWHSNGAFERRVTAYSFLYGVVVPPTEQGGCTYWANLRRAWDEMPDDLATTVGDLKMRLGHAASGLRPGGKFEPTDATQVAIHDVVRTHPVTGRRAVYDIFPGHFVSFIGPTGTDLGDLGDVLERLREHCTEDRFIYRHEWQPGDLIMWDDLSTVHRREPFSSAADRVMKVIDMLEATPSGLAPEMPARV